MEGLLDNREDPEGDCQEIFCGMFENQIIITMQESNKAYRYVKHTCIQTHIHKYQIHKH